MIEILFTVYSLSTLPSTNCMMLIISYFIESIKYNFRVSS